MRRIDMLALEDEVYHEKAFFAMLKELYPNINVTFVKNFDEAIDAYTRQNFDALVIDIRLEGSEKQGDEFIRLIRKNNQNIPIYVLTGIEYAGIPAEKDFVERYGVKWIHKPIYAGDFVENYILKDIGEEKR